MKRHLRIDLTAKRTLFKSKGIILHYRCLIHRIQTIKQSLLFHVKHQETEELKLPSYSRGPKTLTRSKHNQLNNFYHRHQIILLVDTISQCNLIHDGIQQHLVQILKYTTAEIGNTSSFITVHHLAHIIYVATVCNAGNEIVNNPSTV